MKRAVFTKTFEKDMERCLRRGWDKEKFKTIACLLLAAKRLPVNARPHPLSGSYSGYFDCHIANDWVLIYQITDTEIRFIRMGSHADLF